MEKKNMSEFLNMGTAIALCTAIGIVLGAFLQKVVLCLFIGAGIGVILGAVLMIKNCKTNKPIK